MTKTLLLALLSATLLSGCAGTPVAEAQTLPAPSPSPSFNPSAPADDETAPPLPFEVTPVTAPVQPFLSGGQAQLIYELLLTNTGTHPLELRSVTVGSAEGGELLTLEGDALRKAVATSSFAPGQRATLFLYLSVDRAPSALTHHFSFAEGELTLEQPVAVNSQPPLAIDPPVQGGPWLCDGAPSEGSYHRRAIYTINGVTRLSQRYAIDYERYTASGKTFEGDPGRNESYPCYGLPVFASTDGVVVHKIDGLPDNTPPNVPSSSTLDAAGGNSLTIRLPNGQFLDYGHFQPGSMTVKEGDPVTRGQKLGLIGNSGNSFEPHLHQQLCDRGSFLVSDGLAYVLTAYTLDGAPHSGELPLQNQVVTFP